MHLIKMPVVVVWWYALVIPTLGSWRQEDLWGLLASQSDLIGELKANEKPYLKEGRHFLGEQHSRLSSCLHIRTHTHSCAHTWACTYTQVHIIDCLPSQDQATVNLSWSFPQVAGPLGRRRQPAVSW